MIHPTVKVSQNKDGMKKLMAALEKAEGSFVKVGWQGPAKYPNGTRVAQVAIWNEFGTYVDGKLHVPPRPFLRPAIRENEKALMAAAKASLVNVAFKGWKVERGLGALGFRAQEYIRAKIKSNVGPELADKTEARKRAAGRPLVTLIDTRRMLDTLSFKVTLGDKARQEEEHGEGAPNEQHASGHSSPHDKAAHAAAERTANRARAQAALAARRKAAAAARAGASKARTQARNDKRKSAATARATAKKAGTQARNEKRRAAAAARASAKKSRRAFNKEKKARNDARAKFKRSAAYKADVAAIDAKLARQDDE